jgi:hypothetical protein
MMIKDGGNVGIGSAVPVSTLDVSGDIKLTGSLKTSTITLSQIELGYLDGVTSNIQDQFTGKQDTLTFGSIASGSSDSVTSGTIFTALSGKQDTLSSSNKLDGGAIELATTSAIEDSTGLRLKSTLAGTNLTMNNQVLNVDTTASVTENSTVPITSGSVFTALSGKQDTLTFGSIASGSSDSVTSGTVYTALSGKQDTLTFGSIASGSSDSVTSGTVYTALSGKQDTLTFGSIASGSSDSVTSDTVYTALSGKQDTLTFGSIASGSSDSVTSDTVYTALSGKQDTLTFGSIASGSSDSVTSGTVFTALSGKQDSLTFGSIASGSSDSVTSGTVFTALSGKQDTLTFGSIASGSSDSVTSGTVYTALSGKQATVTGAATTITTSNLTTDRALISNGSGKVAISDITSTELGYLYGVTSNIQTQINSISSSSGVWSTSTVDTNDIYYSTGDVGIGTTNPQATLDVSGDISEKGELLEDKYNFKNSSWSGRFQIDTSSNFTIDISFNNDAGRILNFLFDVEYIGSSSNGGRDTYFKNRYGFNKYTSNITPVIVDSEYISTQSYEVFTEYIHDATATGGQRGAIQINIRPPVYSQVINSRVYVNIYSNSNTFEVTDTMLTNGSSNTTITDVNPLMDSSNTASFNGPNYKIFGGSVGIGTNNPDKALSVAGEINSTGLHLNTNTQDNIQNATNTFILNGSNASINDINSSTALTLNGGATISSNGVVLDGLNDFITIPKSLLNFGSNNFTISLWAEYKGANSNGDINGNTIFNIGNYSSGTASFIIYLGINNEIKFYSTTEYIGEETSGYTYRLSDKKFEADGIIHNFVITRSSNILRLFVDGVNAFSNNMDISGQTFDDVDYEIGYYTGGNNNRYTKMDVHRLDIWKTTGFTNVDDIYNAGYTSSLIYGSITGSIDETTKMGKLTFRTSSNGTTLTDNMTILPDGNVGIGSAQPSSKLDVNGTLNVTAATTLGSTLDVYGDVSFGGITRLNNDTYIDTSLVVYGPITTEVVYQF